METIIEEFIDTGMNLLPLTIKEGDSLFRNIIPIKSKRLCQCKPNSLNCLTGKEWLKCQLGVWQFYYEARDIRDKKLHPATFPISLAKKIITLFSHEGELVLDPFVGSGTTLLACQDTNRASIGFDLQEKYIDLCASRISNIT